MQVFARYDEALVRVLEYRPVSGNPVRIPVFVVAVSGTHFEAYSPYGYSTIGLGHLTFAPLLPELLTFLREQNIVDFFLRHDPWSRSHVSLGEPETTQIGEVFSLNLEGFSGQDRAKLDHVPQKRRSLVRRALNEGLEQVLTVARDASPIQKETFENLYRGTMVANSSRPYYFFDPAFFKGLFYLQSDALLLVEVRNRKTHEILSSALFVSGPDSRAHYFLSGNHADSRNTGASDLVIYAAANHFSGIGFETLNLGGATSLSGDGLRAFKKGWSSFSSPYFVTKLVSKPGVYAQLRASHHDPHPGIFLLHQLYQL